MMIKAARAQAVREVEERESKDEELAVGAVLDSLGDVIGALGGTSGVCGHLGARA